MLSPEDIEAIRKIIREELQNLHPPKTKNAIRQARWRAKKNAESVTRNVTVSRNGVTNNASSSTNGVTDVTKSVTNNVTSQSKEEKESSKEREELFSLPVRNKPKETLGGVGGRAKRSVTVLMSNAALRKLAADPLYAGIDLEEQAIKFERWCKANKKLNTVRRFVNWINRSS